MCYLHLTCKVENKYVNAHELLDVIEKNKNGPFPSPTILRVISFWKKILIGKKINIHDKLVLITLAIHLRTHN